jgi:hypothetical protein
MQGIDHINVYDEPEGRIYTRAGGRCISPAYLANDYVQWNPEHQKYGCYKYDPMPSSGPKGGIIIPGSALVAPQTHDRVGATPFFEEAMNWLLGKGRN